MDASGFDRAGCRINTLRWQWRLRAPPLMRNRTSQRPSRIKAKTTARIQCRAAAQLAPRLREWLAREAADREINPLMARALSLACVAADLDTGNVGDAFLLFCEGARRLCEEREMRARRSLRRCRIRQVLHRLSVEWPSALRIRFAPLQFEPG